MSEFESGTKSKQEIISSVLHERFSIRAFDNAQVWAGNMELEVGDQTFGPEIARVFLSPSGAVPAPVFRVYAELYVRGVTDLAPLEPGDVQARLWTDVNKRGFMDERGTHQPDPGDYARMDLFVDSEGNVVRKGNNALFVSEPLEIKKTGVFSYTVEFSADCLAREDQAKEWLSVNDVAHNRDGVIVVTPSRVKECPSVMEICVRKYGARVDGDVFKSGKLKNVTADVENIPVDVLYLLPIYLPGTGDVITGKDVRKGTLGSVYAVKDFYRLDPEICSDPRRVDIKGFVSRGLITEYDLLDLTTGEQRAEVQTVSDLNHFKHNDEIVDFLGEETAVQIVGRAELRELTARAHELGKDVIVDLVLMQTSRDCPLINERREWYELDDDGAPKKHSIAWLDYSDVALFKLRYNRPLQNFLSSIAPYWIKECGLDGVRVDASQTVDPVFIKQIKNRINDVKPDAIVLGETLCPMHEAIDVPVDMIYSLLVDHHVNIERATPYYDLFETYHREFPVNTIGMSYFENHDSARASAHWHERFLEITRDDARAALYWKKQLRQNDMEPADAMAALKSLQCSLINMLSGSAEAVNFSYALENGTDFAERTRTDFENDSLLDFSLRDAGVGKKLHDSYVLLHKTKKRLGVISTGRVFYLRDNHALKHEDRVFALARYVADEHLLLLANLDPARKRVARFAHDFLDPARSKKFSLEVVYDSYDGMGLDRFETPATLSGHYLREGLAEFDLLPLQSVVISFKSGSVA